MPVSVRSGVVDSARLAQIVFPRLALSVRSTPDPAWACDRHYADL